MGNSPAKIKAALKVEALKHYISYDPKTGIFTWIRRYAIGHGRPETGVRAGRRKSSHYREIQVLGTWYAEHRLAWLFMTGAWPTHYVDHINGIRDDNRWCNLRSATPSQNQCNSKKPISNTSGYKGVWFAKNNPTGPNPWCAEIRVNGKKKRLGFFPTAFLAHEAYKAAAKKYHGEFAKLE